MEKLRNALIIVSIGLIASLLYAWHLYGQNQQSQNQIFSLQSQLSAASSTAATFNAAYEDEVNEYENEVNKNIQVNSQLNGQQNLQGCLTQAHEAYVAAADMECTNAGYSQAQVDNLECDLPTADSQNLLNSQTQAQAMCVTLYKN